MKIRSVILTSVVISIIAVLANCNNREIGFTLRPLYLREKFSGMEMNGKVIGVSPLLGIVNQNGTEFLSNAQQFVILQKKRPELKFVPGSQIQHEFLKKWSSDSLNFFWDLLKKGEVASISVRDSLWNAIHSDYLLVFRMVSASTIKTFNRTIRKKIHLETELWDCRGKEAIWRISINGICLSKSISDSLFLIDAAQKAVEALPELLPGYGMESW